VSLEAFDPIEWEPVPDSRCTECGFEFDSGCGPCQGHQWCQPECPKCGGEIEELS
jgi:hypothetical protein